jgi:chemotaxis protein MotA
MFTPIGIVMSFVAIIGAMVMEGGQPASLVSSPSALILVLLGTFGVGAASMGGNIGVCIKGALKAMKGAKYDAAKTTEEIVGFADIARREGLLALEEKIKTVEEPFLKRGLELVIDGSDPEAVADTLWAEVGSLKERHKVAQKFWSDMGGFSPTIGIIGTVMGLIHTMENLSNPSKLGPLIASAFLATLWGVMMANVVYLPIGNKLKQATAAEVAHMEIVIQGVLSIQAGASPRAVGDRLRSLLAPKLREATQQKKSA